jgi:hypothetical protein
MRITLFVAVVAVHLLVIWLLTTLRRAGLHEEELALVPISVLPEELQPLPLPTPRGALTQRAGSSQVQRISPPTAMEAGPAPSNTENTVAPPAPDWRAQAEITAQLNAQQIVAAEDDAKRRANALTAPYKPMPGPRVRGHQFGWDLHPKYRFSSLGQGAFVFPLSEQCAMVVVVLPWFGCSLGPKPAANGDLFKYMRGPVKYGDWDWRVQDP